MAPTPVANADERLDEPGAKMGEPSDQDEPAEPVAASKSVEALETKSARTEDDRVETDVMASEPAESAGAPHQGEAGPEADQPSVDAEAPVLANGAEMAEAAATSDPVDEDAPAAEPLTQPVVTSGSEGEGEDKRPRRTGWWSRRGFL